MVKKALLALVEAKSGQEEAVAEFLESALELVNQETGTVTWYALRFDQFKFGIFDTFNDDDGRQAHLNGKVAAALTEHASELFTEPPTIQEVDILAAK